jgi:hypothetical protein
VWEARAQYPARVMYEYLGSFKVVSIDCLPTNQPGAFRDRRFTGGMALALTGVAAHHELE